MERWLKNPITIAYLTICVVLFLFATVIGFGIFTSLQLLVIPYTYDYSKGIGSLSSQWVAVALLTIQILLLGLIRFIPLLASAAMRQLLWAVGVLLVVVFFTLTLVAFLSTGIH